MVLKRKLDNLQDWHDWISERFGIENIVNGDTATPMNYPCIVSWCECDDYGMFRDDYVFYHFVYLSDFINN